MSSRSGGARGVYYENIVITKACSCHERLDLSGFYSPKRRECFPSVKRLWREPFSQRRRRRQRSRFFFPGFLRHGVHLQKTRRVFVFTRFVFCLFFFFTTRVRNAAETKKISENTRDDAAATRTRHTSPRSGESAAIKYRGCAVNGTREEKKSFRKLLNIITTNRFVNYYYNHQVTIKCPFVLRE